VLCSPSNNSAKHRVKPQAGEVFQLFQLLLYPASDRDNDVSVATSSPSQKAHALFLTESLGAVGNRDDSCERATQYNGKKNKDEEAVQHW
jgi:hypothetical protein